jgi:DNA-binding transcriptional LysR family regulator
MMFKDPDKEMLSATLRQLEYATAIARHGGMTAAAAALNVSQPALSVAVAQLEAQLGHSLFLRQPGRMIPSSFGAAWLAEAEARLADLRRLMQGPGQTAPVPFAFFDDLAPGYLAPLMARLPGEGLTLAPQVLGFDALAESLLRGEVALALTWDLGLPPAIARTPLLRVAPHAVLPPEHPLANHLSLSLAELAAEPLVLTDQGLSIAHFRALFASRGLQPRIAHRSPSLDLMRSFAANGLGVGLSYTRPAPDHSHDGRPLVTRPIRDAGDEAIVLARLAANPLSPAAQRLLDRLPSLLPLLAAPPTIPPMADQGESWAADTATRRGG